MTRTPMTWGCVEVVGDTRHRRGDDVVVQPTENEHTAHGEDNEPESRAGWIFFLIF